MNTRKGSSSGWQEKLHATNPERKPGPADLGAPKSSLKPIMLLTALLFLLVAPAPDSRDIAEMSANFLVVKNPQGLLAAEEQTKPAVAKDQEYDQDR